MENCYAGVCAGESFCVQNFRQTTGLLVVQIDSSDNTLEVQDQIVPNR